MLPDYFVRHARAIGALSIAVCLLTWGLDYFEFVGPCIYCRIQRTLIGILGVFLFLPAFGGWFVRLGLNMLALFGAVVAANQHFIVWDKIAKGELFYLYKLPHDNSFILSFLAIGVFIVQAFIINRRADVAEKLGGRSHRVIRPCNLAPVVRRGCRPTLVIVYAYA
ncbi:hypothetical protein FQY83_03385 [Luteimonas marina]|jgi:hypothetical protein|uniref:Disulfide bond formation protein B n=1 Tax=Luteimonas marina TaxID=488485 RepID=A0A5C5UCJ5_9GAMM|nr:hypothetical protein [Luteimonas marina]TWT23676.1 hypothetical protein FQY83_03385 [Luteimonas marina]